MLVWKKPPQEHSDIPRYQIMTSGISTLFTFLIDNITGNTWFLTTKMVKVEDVKPMEVEGWFPIQDKQMLFKKKS